MPKSRKKDKAPRKGPSPVERRGATSKIMHPEATELDPRTYKVRAVKSSPFAGKVHRAVGGTGRISANSSKTRGKAA